MPVYYVLICAILVLMPTSSIANNFQSESHTLRFSDEVPSVVAQKVAKQVEEKRKLVLAYLQQSPEFKATPFPLPYEVIISDTKRIPYQDGNRIYIPQNRVLNRFLTDKATSTSAGLGIVHELTHVFAVSANRKNRDRFYDDGLAVLLQQKFGDLPEYPNFGQDLYVATAHMATEYGEIIPLAEADSRRGKAKSGTERQLCYLQQGAFTQFLIERYGLDTYLCIYFGESIEKATGSSFSHLENAWRNLIINLQ